MPDQDQAHHSQLGRRPESIGATCGCEGVGAPWVPDDLEMDYARRSFWLEDGTCRLATRGNVEPPARGDEVLMDAPPPPPGPCCLCERLTTWAIAAPGLLSYWLCGQCQQRPGGFELAELLIRWRARC